MLDVLYSETFVFLNKILNKKRSLLKRSLSPAVRDNHHQLRLEERNPM